MYICAELSSAIGITYPKGRRGYNIADLLGATTYFKQLDNYMEINGLQLINVLQILSQSHLTLPDKYQHI